MENTNHLRSLFLLDPDITFLNFGSFGASPKPIFEDYQKWQVEFERQPIQFATIKGLAHLKNSREAIGNYINCNADDVVFVTNPSYATNIVAKSIDLKPGDEVLTTDLEYGAADKAWDHYSEKRGYKMVRSHIELPIKDKQHFIENFFKGLSSRTRLIFISQITSTTGLIFPVKEICDIAKEKGLMTFVDGAHVPGHIPLDLQQLKADFYTGACHKWMMTPKGSSFLYVKKEFQPLDPAIVSWGYKSFMPSHSKFLDHHQMQGTRDYSAFLTIPKALQFMREYSWETVARNSRDIVKDNALRFFDLVGSKPLAPLTDEFFGQLCSIPIKTSEPEKLQRCLYENYGIEIPVMRHGDKVYLRYSINAFNSSGDLDKLFEAVKDIKAKTNYIQ